MVGFWRHPTLLILHYSRVEEAGGRKMDGGKKDFYFYLNDRLKIY